MANERTLTLPEMRHKLYRILKISHRVYLWQVIIFLVIAIVLLLHSLHTSEKLEPHLQAEKVSGCISDVEKAMKWTKLPNKMENLNENPVYAQFNISRKEKPSKVNILIIVSSAPKRSDRRLAIRETWWQQCRSTKTVSGHLFLYLGMFLFCLLYFE